jgi:hypothetical protein
MTRFHAEVREPLTRSIPTCDARSRDTVLLPPTAAELDAWYAQTGRMAGIDLGTVYNGISKMLSSLPAKDRKRVRDLLIAEAKEETDPALQAAHADPGAKSRASDTWPNSYGDFGERPPTNAELNAGARKRWGQDPAR